MQTAALIALPRETLLKALASGGALVSVDASVTCRELRDLFAEQPREKERLRVQAMCTAMAEHSEDLAVQENACSALRAPRVWGSLSSRRVALDAGAIGLIVTAMRRHAESQYMAYIGCETLYLAFMREALRDQDDSAARELMERMAEEGVMEATVAALEAFDRPVRLQQAGLELIHSMCSSHYQPCERRIRRAVHAGAIEVGVAALWDEDANVRDNACWMLANVCCSRNQLGAGQRAVAAGAIEPLIDAIRTLDDNEEAIRAMLNIVSNCGVGAQNEIREQIVAAGGEECFRSLARERIRNASGPTGILRLCMYFGFEVDVDDDDDDGDD